MSRWRTLQDASFLDIGARLRARGLVDEGSFTELVGPEERYSSPHLPELGEALEFDDGIVVGVGLLGRHPAVVISQEGRFIGGAVGEVGGAKMVGALQLAQSINERLQALPASERAVRRPIAVISFETGGVRLHEANAGLLAHAEVMDQIQNMRGRLPVVAVIGSKVGCFGGMGFVAAATDVVVMSEYGRLGLTGPEVIEQEMGRAQFDASDRALVFRTTGGKHKFIMRDCNYLVEDRVAAFRAKLIEIADMPMTEIEALRRVGSRETVARQIRLASFAQGLAPKDSTDMWIALGNDDPRRLLDADYTQFMAIARRLDPNV